MLPGQTRIKKATMSGQGSCGKTKKFHHVCNAAWLESKSVTDSELWKLCID
jgi:ribosomal protein L32